MVEKNAKNIKIASKFTKFASKSQNFVFDQVRQTRI